MTTSKNSIILKEKQVSELSNKINNAKTLMIASIKGLPSKQFQNIKKSVRDYALVKVASKNILLRALKSSKVSSLEDYVGAECVFIISDLDAYELAGILAQKKTPVFAKAGQVAEDDIEVSDGPTDLVPGPAISELGALGLQVAVEDGKISIKAKKVVVSKGETISEGAASIFQKLNIMPFSVGLQVNVAYDVGSKKIFTEMKIDPEGYTEELKVASGKALGFAQKILYFCKETIGHFLLKGNADANVMKKYDTDILSSKDETQEGGDNIDVAEKIEEKVENDGNVEDDVKEDRLDKLNDNSKNKVVDTNKNEVQLNKSEENE
jgi:large subunit ribosomal protein L10